MQQSINDEATGYSPMEEKPDDKKKKAILGGVISSLIIVSIIVIAVASGGSEYAEFEEDLSCQNPMCGLFLTRPDF